MLLWIFKAKQHDQDQDDIMECYCFDWVPKRSPTLSISRKKLYFNYLRLYASTIEPMKYVTKDLPSRHESVVCTMDLNDALTGHTYEPVHCTLCPTSTGSVLTQLLMTTNDFGAL